MNSNDKFNQPAGSPNQNPNRNASNLGQSSPKQDQPKHDQPQQEQQSGHRQQGGTSSSSGKGAENSPQKQTGFPSKSQSGQGEKGGMKPSERSPEQENL